MTHTGQSCRTLQSAKGETRYLASPAGREREQQKKKKSNRVISQSELCIPQAGSSDS